MNLWVVCTTFVLAHIQTGKLNTTAGMPTTHISGCCKCCILASLLGIRANLTMHVRFTRVHCLLTLAAAHSSLAQPHWISACLTLLNAYAPKATDKLTVCLTHVIEHVTEYVTQDVTQALGNNNNNLQAFQLIVLARYLLGVPNPSPVSQHALT